MHGYMETNKRLQLFKEISGIALPVEAWTCTSPSFLMTARVVRDCHRPLLWWEETFCWGGISWSRISGREALWQEWGLEEVEARVACSFILIAGFENTDIFSSYLTF